MLTTHRFLFLILIFLFTTSYFLEKIRHSPNPRQNIYILDTENQTLAQQSSERFGYRQWKPLEQIHPQLVQALLNQEDHRFYGHLGIDPFAIGRALWVNLKSLRLVQGASTLTQQYSKMLLENYLGHRVSRNLFWKMMESFLAFDCELHYTKQEILERYLNNAYLGHRLYGVEAASKAYFGKPNLLLNDEEIKTLARHFKRPEAVQEIKEKPSLNNASPHLLAWLKNKAQIQAAQPDADLVFQSTLNKDLQKKASEIVQEGVQELQKSDPQIQAALVVIDVQSSSLQALVGSANFFESREGAQVNHALALRQPGSTLKPFTYFLAFEHGRFPSDLVVDAPYHFYQLEDVAYSPRNFDRRYHGVLTLREALANSFNIPAVLTLEEMGTSYYLDLLHEFGFRSLDESPAHYGLALTLGSGSVTLLELSNAYAALARGGEFRELIIDARSSTLSFQRGRDDKGDYESGPKKQAAFLVTSILSDSEARRLAFGDADLMNIEEKKVAIKTGTSHDSRDAWAMGYSPRYVVGVWVGHTDNSPMPGFTGAQAAVPLWHQIMQFLEEGKEAQYFNRPANLVQKAICEDEVCQKVGLEWLPQNQENLSAKAPHESLRFIRPTDGAHYLFDLHKKKEDQKILCELKIPEAIQKKYKGTETKITWMLDGEFLRQSKMSENKFFLSLNPGTHELKAFVGEEKARRVRMKVSEIER
ncbi:MAG: transglycosylase domain-containing protein [Deltaproteobacteria bacterium]|nr:transglycosylase domain-containing protein [Deltaproteobacteria bacterium]